MRLVYAPAEGIGVFGGETDNWRWPRHTGDWSFLPRLRRQGRQAGRLLEGQRAVPAEALAARSPAGGVKPGDLVFVVGYPGRTQRHQTYAEVKATTEWAMPRSIRLAEEQLAILDKLPEAGQGPRAEGGRTGAGPQQRADQHQGRARGPGEGRQPRAQAGSRSRSWPAWIAADPARQQKYGDVLPGDAGAAGGLAEDPRAQRRPRPASRAPRPTWAPRRPSTASRCSGRRATSSATPGSRSATGAASARRRSGCSGRSTRRWTARCSRGRWPRRRRCRPGSGSSRSTRPPGCAPA